ncbi:MAG: aryl-sulfate sulfotransferase [Chloroflexota bacterium]
MTQDKSLLPENLTNQEAVAILKKLRASTLFLFNALDLDGDGELSPAEIDAAPQTLRALDRDGDGMLNESELEGGGFHLFAGWVRNNSIVRMLDLDGDLCVTAADMEDAPNRIRRLDKDGDGIVKLADVVRQPNPNMRKKMGSPAQLLRMNERLRSYPAEAYGSVMPGQDSRALNGYTLIYEANNNDDVQVASDAFLLDENGRFVHAWHNALHTPEGTTAELLESGLLLRSVAIGDALLAHHFPVGAHGTIQLVDWDGTVLWQFSRVEIGKHCLHHDSEPLPNGNILVTSYEAMTVAEAEALGWRPQAITTPRGDGFVWVEKILELKPNLDDGTTEIVWEWDILDHIVQDHDANKPNYGSVTDNPRKLDLNYTQFEWFFFSMGQLFHINAVSYSAERDQIVLSSAKYDEFWIIDHSISRKETAGDKGDLLYRWGNPSAYGAGKFDDKALFWQHDVQWMDRSRPHSGDIMIFNNGAQRNADGTVNYNEKGLGFGTAYTEILELRLPFQPDGSFDWSKPVEISWGYNRDGSKGVFSPFMSSASRTPDGNTLLVLGYNKRLIEVTDQGETVLDYRLGGPGRIYRALRYSADYPGLRKLGV